MPPRSSRFANASFPRSTRPFSESQEVDSLEALKTRVRENVKLQKEHQNRIAIRRQVADALVAEDRFRSAPGASWMPRPRPFLRQLIEEKHAPGRPGGAVREGQEGPRREARSRPPPAGSSSSSFSPRSPRRKRSEVTERDIDAFINREADRANVRPEKVAKDLGRDNERLRSVRQSIIFDKAVDFLVSKANVKVRG